jgi:hypothetical protein
LDRINTVNLASEREGTLTLGVGCGLDSWSSISIFDAGVGISRWLSSPIVSQIVGVYFGRGTKSRIGWLTHNEMMSSVVAKQSIYEIARLQHADRFKWGLAREGWRDLVAVAQREYRIVSHIRSM